MLSLGSWVECFWVSQLMLDGPVQTKRVRFPVSPVGGGGHFTLGAYKACKCWEASKAVENNRDQWSVLGESHQEPIFVCDSEGCYLVRELILGWGED